VLLYEGVCRFLKYPIRAPERQTLWQPLPERPDPTFCHPVVCCGLNPLVLQLEEEKLKNDEAEFNQQFIFGDYSRSPLEQLLPLASDVYLPMLVKNAPHRWPYGITAADHDVPGRRICGRVMWCPRCTAANPNPNPRLRP